MRVRIRKNMKIIGLLSLVMFGAAGCGGGNGGGGSSGAYVNATNLVVFGQGVPDPNFANNGLFTLDFVAVDANGNTIVGSNDQPSFHKTIQIALLNLLVRQALAAPGDFTCAFTSGIIDPSVSCNLTGTTVSPPLVPSTQNVAAAVLLDSSGSMASTDPSELRKQAAGDFLELISTNDTANQIAGYDFTTPSGPWAPTPPFADTRILFDWALADATNVANGQNQINANVGAFGDTPLFDSLVELCNDMNVNPAILAGYFKTILLLSDGADTASTLNLNDVTTCLDGTNILVNVIGLSSGIDAVGLQAIANVNGGFFAETDSATALDALFQAMAGVLFTGSTVAQVAMSNPSACISGSTVTGTLTIVDTGASANFSFVCP